jgi:hypothetical protein
MGLTWNATIETGGLLVSGKVTIQCEVELINKGLRDKTMELENKSPQKGTL